MRARIINEGVNFERNTDPKSALRIGLSRWTELKKGQKLYLKEILYLNKDNKIDDLSRYDIFKKGSPDNPNYFTLMANPHTYNGGYVGLSVEFGNDQVHSNKSIYIVGKTPDLDRKLSIYPVNESVNFERGIDPKRSMQIGLTGKWMSLRKGDMLLIKRDFTVNQKGRIDDKSIHHHYLRTAYSKLYLEIDTEPILYDDGCVGFTVYVVSGSIINGTRHRSSGDYFIWGSTEELEDRMEKVNLSEGMNFQRGLDPKRSMKIGRHFLPLKKGDNVRVWSRTERRFVMVRLTEDENVDQEGKPKIDKLISSTRPVRKVRRIWVRYLGEVRTANLPIEPATPEEDRWELNI